MAEYEENYFKGHFIFPDGVDSGVYLIQENGGIEVVTDDTNNAGEVFIEPDEVIIRYKNTNNCYVFSYETGELVDTVKFNELIDVPYDDSDNEDINIH